MDEMMHPADYAAINGNGGFGGEGLWIFALLLLLFGGNGGWGRGNEQLATSADVQRGFDQQDTNGQLRGITYGLSDATFALNNSVVNEGRATQSSINNVSTQLAECCCGVNRNIDQLRYDDAMNKCDIITAVHAEGEATRNLIQENKIEALQNKVQALELQNSLAGVVRYPNGFVYNAGNNPFCSCGCNTGCNI